MPRVLPSLSGTAVHAVHDSRTSLWCLPADDAANYVVGLGVDCTCTAVDVVHPTDPTAPDLPPQPVLLVATSDGVLRLYSFGRMDTSAASAGSCIVAPPQALPAPPALVTAASASSEAEVPVPVPAAGPSVEDRAAGTALPSDDESDFEVRIAAKHCICIAWLDACPVPGCSL